MRKILIIIALACSLGITCRATTTYVVIDNIRYEIAANAAYVAPHESSSGLEYSGDIVIPGEIEYEGKTYPVEKILAKTFFKTDGVTSVVIPGSVTSVGSNAFANLNNLKTLIFSDGADKLSMAGSGSSSYPVYNCVVDSIYIGRSIDTSSSSSAYAFHSCSLRAVGFGKDVYSVPSRLLRAGKLTASAGGRFEVPEGILEISTASFYIKDIKHLVLPTSLRKMNSGMFDFNSDFDKGVVLESKAKIPCLETASTPFTSSSSYTFDKLIVPAGSTDVYNYCKWNQLATVVEEAAPTGDDETTDPDPQTKHYITLVAPNSGEGGYSFPRIEVDKDGHFEVILEVENGWHISDASFALDETPSDDESGENAEKAMRAESDPQTPTAYVEKLSEGNRYKIGVDNVTGDGRLSYVVEKETQTESEEIISDSMKPTISVSGDSILVKASENSSVALFDLNGRLLRSGTTSASSLLEMSNLPHGIYLLKVGLRTYKVAL